jgi:hypothetical protein
METTLNMRLDVYDMITRAARSRKISRSDMIAILLKKVMDGVLNPERIGTLVQYQERGRKVGWHTFHLYIREDEYEYYLDLRKLLKMSVSLILAYAVEKYLNKIMKRLGTDNNRYRNYIIAKEFIDGIICWKFIWGFPPNLARFFADP